MNYKEIILDTKGLPSPEPMETVVNALHQLSFGTCIKMIHRMSPRMLYPILKKNGYDFIEKKLGDEEFEIYIFLKNDQDLREFLKNN